MPHAYRGLMTHNEVERRRLPIMVERLHREGRSEREIEAAMREATGYRSRRSVGRRDSLLMRLGILRAGA